MTAAPKPLRLILIRHAKSDWSDPFADDHARVLNARGRAAASAIGAWLAQNGYLPDTVLCSDAARTVETLALILPCLPTAPAVSYLPQLYHAPASRMLAILHKAAGQTVAMIGHNPGIGDFACGLASSPPPHPRFGDYPTCATAVFDFDAPTWDAVRPGTGRAVDFAVPRDLIGGDDAD